MQAYYQTNRVRLDAYKTDWRFRKEYGITLLQFEAMCKTQEGRCAVCGKERKLVVDHDHSTGQVRALLCTGCNFRVGQVEQKGDLLELARKYLVKWDAKTPKDLS